VPETQEREQAQEQTGEHHRVAREHGDRRHGPPAVGVSKIERSVSPLNSVSALTSRSAATVGSSPSSRAAALVSE
jgi:hypothetical protein